MDHWSFSEVILVLEQFGVSFSVPRFATDLADSLRYSLGEVEDKKLAALDVFLGRGGQGVASPELGAWSGQLFRLFLSHTSNDRAFVSELKTALRVYGIQGFVAHEDIEPAAEWLQTILGALDTCDAIAAVLTGTFHSSVWCDQEIGHSIGMRKLVIPLACGQMPYGFMARYQALKCDGVDSALIAKQMADILTESPLTAARMAEALVANLDQSASYAEAKANMKLVKRIAVWTPSLLRRLEGALKNPQVGDAFGVPDAIRTIVAQNSR